MLILALMMMEGSKIFVQVEIRVYCVETENTYSQFLEFMMRVILCNTSSYMLR